MKHSNRSVEVIGQRQSSVLGFHFFRDCLVRRYHTDRQIRRFYVYLYRLTVTMDARYITHNK